MAEIQGNLSNANVEFNKLKETTEQYMVVREKEAEDRVIKVLRESRNALEEISKNHKELTDFNRELQAYAIDMKVLSTSITNLFTDFNIRMDDADSSMEVCYKEINDILIKIKTERVHVAEDRKMLGRERQRNNEETLLLKDRRGTLERAWKELKNKKHG